MEGYFYLCPIGFPLRFRNVTASSNFSFEAFLQNLVSLTCPSDQISDETQMEVFPSYNCITRNNIDIKLGPVTKHEKQEKHKNVKKNWWWRHYAKLWLSSLIFSFMADLELSRSQIPDAWSVILSFSLIATFYFTKTENKNKEPISLSKSTIFAKNADFLQKKCWHLQN